MPAILIPLVLFFTFGKAVIVSGVIALVLVVGLGTLFVATGGVRAALDWMKGDEPDALWYMDQEELEMLTCNPDRKAYTFSNLPNKKKTLGLRFSNLKSKVCRPFSA